MNIDLRQYQDIKAILFPEKPHKKEVVDEGPKSDAVDMADGW